MSVFTTIPSALIAVGKSLKRDLFSTYIKDSLDSHEERIVAVEGGASKVIVFNQIISRPPAVGDICHSYLTEVEFQARYGTDWVLADGDNIAGSDLAGLRTWTTIPDSRGRFLRMKDHSLGLDEGGERDLGNNQASANLAHTHTDSTIGTYSTSAIGDTANGTGGYPVAGTTTSSTGGTESRPVNTCVNIFVRINDGAEEGVAIFRAPFAFDLIGAVCTTLSVGADGTLAVDVQKGSDLDTMTTVFSTLPSVGFGEGSNASSSNGVFSTTDVALGDWLRLDISSLQTNQTDFHMQLTGEVS